MKANALPKIAHDISDVPCKRFKSEINPSSLDDPQKNSSLEIKSNAAEGLLILSENNSVIEHCYACPNKTDYPIITDEKCAEKNQTMIVLEGKYDQNNLDYNMNQFDADCNTKILNNELNFSDKRKIVDIDKVSNPSFNIDASNVKLHEKSANFNSESKSMSNTSYNKINVDTELTDQHQDQHKIEKDKSV